MGVLKARVDGVVWVPISASVAPPVSGAQGVVNTGVFNLANGTLLPSSGRTVIATVSNFNYVSGRRYRLFIELNAITAQSAPGGAITAEGFFDIGIDGVVQNGGVHIQAQITGYGHTHFSWEFCLERYSLSAGLHQLTVGFGPVNGRVVMYNDMGAIEVRDVGV